MKIREGFVSNSSSSSFIIIDRSKNNYCEKALKSFIKKVNIGARHKYILNLPIKGGAKYFGREYKTFHKLSDRLNFMTLQFLEFEMYYGRKDDEVRRISDIIYNVIEKAVKTWDKDPFVSIRYDYNVFMYGSNDDFFEYYIDHQSSFSDGENTEMFKSEESLYNFLFGRNSRIYMGSDELPWTEDFYRGLLEYYEGSTEDISRINRQWKDYRNS